MSSEHDRLLAQGPRVAPEPQLASDDGSVAPAAPAPAAPAVVPDATDQAKPLRLPSGAGTPRRSRGGFGRRLVPLLVALGLAARTIGHGRWEIGVFIAIAVLIVTVVLIQRARQL